MSMIPKFKITWRGKRRIVSATIDYHECPKCGLNSLTVLEQGYSFVVYLCDCCGAKLERVLC